MPLLRKGQLGYLIIIMGIDTKMSFAPNTNCEAHGTGIGQPPVGGLLQLAP